jgi:RimJ/RimL family protein N-acetyltransferase
MLMHSPFLAEHSPGKLHLQRLGEFLIGEGYDAIDLTPGGDPWKERFANAHDEVLRVHLYAKPSQARRAQWRDWLEAKAKVLLARVSLEPSHIREFAARLRNPTLGSLVRAATNWLWQGREFRIYRLAAHEVRERSSDARVSCNAIGELLRFEPGERWQSRERFLGAALARLEAGERAYTVCLDGKLAHSGWLIPRQHESRMSEVGQTLHLPPNSAVLYDFYTQPGFRGRGLYRATINHMLADLSRDPTLEFVYISVLADNLASRKVIERLGFTYQGSFYQQRRFGRITRSSDTVFTLPEGDRAES